jgi:hypothetical protein
MGLLYRIKNFYHSKINNNKNKNYKLGYFLQNSSYIRTGFS